jgi:amidophosphoribosyltransferase
MNWSPATPDQLREECGVVGISGHREAAKLACIGLYALQHRGQESAGMVSCSSRKMYVHKGMGLVADVFDQAVLRRLPGRYAIGHVRHSTAGANTLRDAQPFLAESTRTQLAVALDGNLINAAAVRRELEERGSIFQSTTDSEIFVHLLSRSQGCLEKRLTDVLLSVRGSYSLVLLADDTVVAARDPYGFRPLSLGRLGSAWIVASETCAFDLIGANYERDVEPGEMVMIHRGRLRSLQALPREPERSCVFEHIYFSRPDSIVYGANVYQVRKQLGRELAREHPVAADIVVPVLDSGSSAALGYAEAAGIPYETALVRNHYVRRAFIEPEQSIRLFGVRVKHNPIRQVVVGKRLVLVKDSIVRGTTLRRLVSLFRVVGAREIHVRVSSPPTTGSCDYGIDGPRREELIAATKSVEEICKVLDADSLGYLSLEALRRVEVSMKHGFCDACFSGEYVFPVEHSRTPDSQLPLFEGKHSTSFESEVATRGTGRVVRLSFR